MINNIVRKIVVLAVSLAAGAAFFVSYGFAAGIGNPNNHISFINLSVNDGLSQCTVLSCVQDTLGRMWFATQDGLNLYDGYEFRTFRNDAQDSTSVANNIIRKVYLDKSGNIWVGTGKGLSWYDARSESFRNFATDDRAVTGIADTGDGRLMVAAGGDLLFFDKAAMRFDEGNVLQYSGNIRVTELFSDEEGVWIGTAADGVLCWSPDNNGVRRIFSPGGGRNMVQAILRNGNELWIATEGDGLWMYDIKSNVSVAYHSTSANGGSINSNYVRSLALDVFGRLWVGTYNGLSILENGVFQKIQSDPFLDGSLSQSSVRCILRDNQGGMWLGTYFGGINYWHPRMNRFHVIKREPVANSLNDNVVSCFAEDNQGFVWIGTNSGGLNCFDQESGRFTVYKLRDTGREKLESDDIKAIFVDKRNGTIFVGAHAGGLSRVDRHLGRLSPYDSDTPNPLDVYALAPAPQGRVWVGTLEGLKSFDPGTSVFTSFDYDADGNPLSDWSVRTLLNDSAGRLWVGLEQGLGVFDTTSGKLKALDFCKACPELEDAFVQCLCETSTKLVWIGTRSGLYCWRPAKNEFASFTSKDGLPSDIVSGMEEDRFGRLWISTDRGLCCFNPLSGHFRNYTLEDGLPGNQFNPGAHLCLKNGRMLFGGVQGITTFRPEQMEDNPFTPKPQISRLEVSGVEIRPGDGSGILEQGIAFTERIVLPHDMNSISLRVSVPNYLSWHHNTFSYKLEGYDRNWHTTEGRSIILSNLHHGKYKLLVKAANNDGKWNEEPLQLDIVVKPIWYNTVWARILFGLMVVAALAGIFIFAIRRKEEEGRLELARQEKVHQEDMHQMKMKFYINISHEMRTPLTFILNPLTEMVARSSDPWMRKQLRYVERNAQRLLHLVNQLMDYRRAELDVFKLKVSREDAWKIIKEICSYYDKLAIRKRLKYSYVGNLEGKTPYIDGQYLELILTNLLSNAFKYTDAGKVSVSATLTPENLVLEVRDTGSGIPDEEKEHIFERFYRLEQDSRGSGIGLSLVRRLVELHHGTITLDSELGKGSAFTVTFPQNLSLYSKEEIAPDDENAELRAIRARDMFIDDSTDLEEVTEESQASTLNVKLLMVEDNEEVRKYMSRGLSRYFIVEQAVNGADALEKMKEFKPDLIVTDLSMPVMDGLKFCSTVKHSSDTAHIPVIMVSTRVDKEYHLEAMKAGADDFIPKPVSLSLLVAKIRNVMRTLTRMLDRTTTSLEIEPEKLSFNALDEQILKKAVEVVEKNIDNAEFSTEDFAQQMNMSRSNLHLKLKSLTGESALDFIRKVRFKEACRLLEDGRYSISEISDRVGFSTPSYFATSFKKYMGCLPTEWSKKHR